MYNIYKRTSPLISIQKNAAGLNRAEVLTVLSALVVLYHIFYKNSSGLALIKVRPFLLRVRDLLLNIKFVEVRLYII
ncbi:unnamed protein product [marine sediment metagenome]|uniref:Uncharacterized protein n=1 Tax=marine sediment metagenome TaxID=412755 RepID=X0ZM54_9ZZZZ